MENTRTTNMADLIKEKMSMYTSRDSTPVCIYKVPPKLKKVKEEAYTPRSVSIGPIHHGRPELLEMERYKWRFLDRYLTENPVSLTSLVQTANDMENQVRDCYQEPYHIRSQEFTEMIMLDGIFVIMFLQECLRYEGHNESSVLYLNGWVRSEIIHDLMLLENQLPLFVLQTFYELLARPRDRPSLMKLETCIPEFFSIVGNIGIFQKTEETSTARHLVDFLRTYYKPKQPSRFRGTVVYNHSATELEVAGVNFQAVPGYDIFEITFIEGTLRIPALRIDDHTETLLLNMIAFEQCQHGESKEITSYVIFMDSLINTSEDVDLLVKCGIIQNYLDDPESLASLFNNLHKETGNQFYFQELCTELNDYSRDFYHECKATWFRSNARKVLKRDYFNTPWSTISVIAAIILLLLTAAQTISSMIPLFQSHQK